MDSPPKLSGETLIVHRIPLVHCQVSGSGRRCGSSLRKSSNPFSCPENLGLIRTTSLPERDVLQREALVYSSLIQTSSSSDAFDEDGMTGGEKKRGLGGGGGMASDTSSFTSSNSEDTPPKILSKKTRDRPSSLRHNPFLLNSGEDDYDEDEDDDGDNLNGYLEDSSFHLHGTSEDLPPFHLHDLGYHGGAQKGAPGRHFSTRLEDLLGFDLQRRHGSSGSTLSMDCGEQEWDDDEDDHCGRGRSECCGFSREMFPDFPLGYCSDSSCNSSDGILVNFSAIYSKTNDGVPDKTMANLNSSAEHTGAGGAEFASAGGAFYLDLHRSPTEAPPETDDPLSSSCRCVSQPSTELDANCNSYHNQEGALPSTASLPNDLTSCMQSEARLVVATQNYYKLVTCDVSSHSSPSPAGSSVTSCSDEHSKGSPTQPTEYFLFRHTKEEEEEGDAQPSENKAEPAEDSALSHVMEGQVYVNISPPVGVASGGARFRSRSYDRNLDKTPPPRLGSLERMLSCPMRLSDSSAPSPTPPARVTSFAEIARNKRRNGGSPSQRSSGEPSSAEFSPIPEDLPPVKWTGPPKDSPGREARTKAEGGPSGSLDSPPVVRYTKDQRPTTLPIQPFTLQQQFGKPQPKPVLPLLDEYINNMQAHLSSAHSEQDDEEDSDEDEDGQRPRPSPLGSYSPPRSLSCPAPPSHTPPTKLATLPPTPPPATRGHCFHRTSLSTLPTLPSSRLSPAVQVEAGRPKEDGKVLPACVAPRHNGQSLRGYGDLLPDYFSQMERPPEEFCLSPDATSEESISIDLHQKRGLVKAVNTAVDLIVAHFGTSRDAGVKAKLGNSSVSPNVAHLILKYLCPAVCEVLQDGLRAYTLDIIIGQRRNQPWSVVEASTQLGPSTRLLHSLYLKVSQYSELTNHSMRLHAFIFGLLNLRSLEFWFSHIYTHEDIIAAHYHPWGFLPLSQGACQPMFEELLLLLQPLSLLPFDLDLLFEPRQLQKGQDQLRRKEQLCSAPQGLDRSARSTFQLMRGSSDAVQLRPKEAELQRGRFVLRREGTWPQMDGAESKRQGRAERRSEGAGSEWERSTVRTSGVGGERRSKQAGWWFQLMQSSQVYIENSTEGSKFVKWERRKKGGGSEGRRQSNPPPRVGVVEGAEARHATDENPERPRASKGKPSWMGSPPESVLSELRRTNEAQPEGAGPETQAHAQNLRWGRLFGKMDAKPSNNQKGRLPSGWLSLDRSVLDLVVQSVGKKAENPTPTTQNTHPAETQPERTHRAAPRQVRALCHHIATETGHLSFHKGDVLQVLGKADSDWLLCALGDTQGLVPIIYVTLNDDDETDESEKPQ